MKGIYFPNFIFEGATGYSLIIYLNCLVRNKDTFFLQVVTLEGLAVYWNCNSVHYANLPIVDIIDHFQREIASKTSNPKGYNYCKHFSC